MNETYLAWLVLVLFVAIGGLSFKADIFKIESDLVSLIVLAWQILFGVALVIAVGFTVGWALVTVAS
jgi:hypothetical protein